MSLFPAYSSLEQSETNCEDLVYSCGEVSTLSPASEAALLADPAPPRPAPPAAASSSAAPADFYLDCKLDRGNLRVSTLYYPARPEYRCLRSTLAPRSAGAPFRARRYWRRTPPPCDPAPELAERAAALRQQLRDRPHDEGMWLRYLDFLERYAEWSPSTLDAAAVEAGAWCLRGPARAAAAVTLRDRAHAALRRQPPADTVRALRGLREDESSPTLRGELYLREVSALACAGDLCAARSVTVAAMRDRALGGLYPALLYTYGAILRSAGLWERLVQLVELVYAMNFPSTAVFPPPPPAAASSERQLAEWSARTIAGGLPGAALWARVERARAALHWRPQPGLPPLELAADPERAPPPAAAADLLRPVEPRATSRLLLTLLRLAEEPLLPASNATAVAASGGIGAAGVTGDWDTAAGLTLLQLVRACRRLPPAHPARAALTPRAARALLALTPLRGVPHDAADTTGFASWRSALWTAALSAATGEARTALLCWRLRTLHARLLMHADQEEAVKRIRRAARDAVKTFADESVTPLVLAARLEAAAAAAGGAGGEPAARVLRPVLAAARLATQPGHDRYVALYAARVVTEVAENCGDTTTGRWALACAVTAQPLPPDAALTNPPPPELIAQAARIAETTATDIQTRLEASEPGDSEPDVPAESVERAMLPGEHEWGAARAGLAGPGERGRLEHELRDKPPARSPALQRWRETLACALCAAAHRDHRAARAAHALQHHARGNAYVALLSGEPNAARCAMEAGAMGSAAGAPRDELGALAALLPALLRAAARDWPAHEAAAVERALGRAARHTDAAGSALTSSLRVAAAGRGAGDAQPALRRLLPAAAHYKWALILGAEAGGGEAGALPELALERHLRLHALPDELHALPDELHALPELAAGQAAMTELM